MPNPQRLAGPGAPLPCGPRRHSVVTKLRKRYNGHRERTWCLRSPRTAGFPDSASLAMELSQLRPFFLFGRRFTAIEAVRWSMLGDCTVWPSGRFSTPAHHQPVPVVSNTVQGRGRFDRCGRSRGHFFLTRNRHLLLQQWRERVALPEDQPASWRDHACGSYASIELANRSTVTSRATSPSGRAGHGWTLRSSSAQGFGSDLTNF